MSDQVPGKNSDVAARIRERRDELGLTDAILAERTGRKTAQSLAVYLSQMSTGNRGTAPRAEFVSKMAAALGVRVEWLQTGELPKEHVDLPPDPEHPERRTASAAALLLGIPGSVIEQARAKKPARRLTVREWFDAIRAIDDAAKFDE